MVIFQFAMLHYQRVSGGDDKGCMNNLLFGVQLSGSNSDHLINILAISGT